MVEARATPLKAELHCHLEGTVSPALAQRLAAAHRLDLGSIIDAQGRYRFEDFSEFLVAYDRVCEAIRTPQDYYEILYDYYRTCAGEGLIYGEMFISAYHPACHGISYPTFLDALSLALDDVERDHGVTARLVLTAVRHLGVEQAEETARLAAAHPHPKVVGFGLAGEENFLAPRDFARAFAIAQDAGLRLTAHAGELAGPDSIRGALRDLKVERIGHGVRAIEDEEVMAEIKECGATLEICPSSNIVLGLYPSIEAHPVARLTAFGIKTSLGSDDPPFVAATIGKEYGLVQAAFALGEADMTAYTTRALDAAFCTEEERAALKARLRAGALGSGALD